MQFQFATLENTKISEVIAVLNLGFADYFVKINLDKKSWAKKAALENIRRENSVGAFVDEKLVGFILTGIEGEKSYNAGTAVLPDARGNRLTEKMYEFILPKLRAENIHFQQLEVIRQNESAIRIYKKIGFKRVRTLACFKGNINTSKINYDVELRFLDEIDGRIFPNFWNAPPSWQNSISALRRTKNHHKIIGAFQKENLIGYAIFTPKGGIKQFAVSKNFRHSGIGQTLFSFIKSELKNKEISITNVEKNDRETISFLRKIGLEVFLEQFEMTMKI